jgi:hypothetical protein
MRLRRRRRRRRRICEEDFEAGRRLGQVVVLCEVESRGRGR